MSEWEKIINEYGAGVWQTAYRLLGEYKDTAECFEGAFISAIEISRIKVVRDMASLLTYLATSKAIECIRNRIKDEKYYTDVISIDDTENSKIPAEELLKSHKLAGKLRDSLVKIAKIEAEVFCLRYLSEMSYANAGKVLGINAEVVKILESRGKEKLQGFLIGGELVDNSMKEGSDNLNRAIFVLKSQHIPQKPPREIIDATIRRLEDENEGIILQRYSSGRNVKMFLLVICAAGVLIVIFLLLKRPAKTSTYGVEAVSGNSPPTTQDENLKAGSRETRPIAATKITERDRKAEIGVGKNLADQLKLVDELFKNGDVEGLLYALEDPREKVKISAAYYLAKLGDEDVAAILKELSKEWKGDPAKNPFAASLILLRSRLDANKPTEPNKSMISPIEPGKKIPEPNEGKSEINEPSKIKAEQNEPNKKIVESNEPNVNNVEPNKAEAEPNESRGPNEPNKPNPPETKDGLKEGRITQREVNDQNR